MTKPSNPSKYGLGNFLSIAKSYVDPDTSTLEGIEKAMITWYAFKFETTLNDPKLLDMTLEELLVLYHMHKIKDNPDIIKQEVAKAEEAEWEKWLQEEMGEVYETQDEMIANMDKEANNYTKKIREKFGELPDEIDTDFSMLEGLGDE